MLLTAPTAEQSRRTEETLINELQPIVELVAACVANSLLYGESERVPRSMKFLQLMKQLIDHFPLQLGQIFDQRTNRHFLTLTTDENARTLSLCLQICNEMGDNPNKLRRLLDHVRSPLFAAKAFPGKIDSLKAFTQEQSIPFDINWNLQKGSK